MAFDTTVQQEYCVHAAHSGVLNLHLDALFFVWAPPLAAVPPLLFSARRSALLSHVTDRRTDPSSDHAEIHGHLVPVVDKALGAGFVDGLITGSDVATRAQVGRGPRVHGSSDRQMLVL